MSDKPLVKVSVIMGIYNCAETLSASIESIVEQTYSNWELIMCDDGSNDNTVKVAKSFVEKYPDKIKLLTNSKNLTLGPTLNRCLKVATGDYIARQDADDISEPTRFEKQVNFLKEQTGYSMVGSSMSVFDESGIYGTRRLKTKPKPSDLMKGSTFCHPTIMIRADVLRELGGYSEDKSAFQVEDYELWFRMFAEGYLAYNLDQNLYRYCENRNAYARKKANRRIREAYVMWHGRRLLGLSKIYSLFVLKPFVVSAIPISFLKLYHKMRLKSIE